MYVLAESFCQDPLKNRFGGQRYLGSSKNNPSMTDFGSNNNAIRNQKHFKPNANSNTADSGMIALTEELHVENLKRNESLNVNLE